MEKLYPLHHHLINPPPLKLSFSSNSQPISHSLQSPPPLSFSSSPKHHFFDDSIELKSLNSVKITQAQMIKMPTKPVSDEFVRNLITCYLKFGDFESSAKFFFVGFARNYQSWDWFLEELNSFGGKSYEVLEVFSELQRKGVVFDSKVLTIVVKICVHLMDTLLGLKIHACLIKRGFDMDVHLKCALMNFYDKCLDMEGANQLFYEMSYMNEMLWSEAIMINLRNERIIESFQIFREMQFAWVKATSILMVKLLQACGKMEALDQGKEIHGYVIRHELQSNNLFVSNSLISMYSKTQKIELARNVFDSMENQNLSSWNSIISGYASHGYLDYAWTMLQKMDFLNVKPDIITWNCLISGNILHGSFVRVLKILQKMQEDGFKPNSSSISSVLQAVSELGLSKTGKEIHSFVIRNGFDYDVYVSSSLLDMYIKNDCLNHARSVFQNMKNINIFAWNSLISGYSYKGMFEEALTLLNQMKQEGIKPDLVTWNGLVSGYAMQGRNEEALLAMGEIKKSGFTPNVVSWTALISGCAQNENYKDSFKFFIEMQQAHVRPNSATISCLLRACAGLSMLQKGKEVHSFCIRTCFVDDSYVSTTLMDMYSKSGDLKSSYKVFKKIKNKTLASWNCMIIGFSIYGLGKKAVSFFEKMCDVGIKPDAITFTAVLSACKNSGLVDEGWKVFDNMSNDYNISPKIEHFSCMVDLLGKAGYIDEAWDFIQTMPLKPDATIWGSILGSCRVHKNLKFAEKAAEKLYKLEPLNSANYVLMMNLYAVLKKWEEVERTKALMDNAGVKNRYIWSAIEIDQKSHVFSENDSHEDSGEIFFELYQLISEMKRLGYAPDVDCVYQNVDDLEKEKVLLGHTEKLAMTYGLMKVKNGAPIRVIKNTRVCSDCHSMAKYMSLVRQREIWLKDGVRFHRFCEGRCSCNDCW